MDEQLAPRKFQSRKLSAELSEPLLAAPRRAGRHEALRTAGAGTCSWASGRAAECRGSGLREPSPVPAGLASLRPARCRPTAAPPPTIPATTPPLPRPGICWIDAAGRAAILRVCLAKLKTRQTLPLGVLVQATAGYSDLAALYREAASTPFGAVLPQA